jgi:hypothetical protein
VARYQAALRPVTINLKFYKPKIFRLLEWGSYQIWESKN